MSTQQTLESVFRTIFKNEDLQITREMTAYDVEGWDSMANINLIIAIEAAFKIKIQASEVIRMRSVGDLIDLVEKKTTQKLH